MKIIKPIFLFFFYCCIIYTGYSQDAICGTANSPANRTDFSSIMMSRGNGTVCVNVFFHIVRNDNQTGGYNPSNLVQLIQLLNLKFNRHGIFFKNNGHGFIDDTDFLDIFDGDEADLLNAQNVQQNAINFYLVETAPWGGRAYNTPSNRLLVVNSQGLTSSATHELGHCFGLHHTHEKIKFGTEYIDRNNSNSNCTTAGDKLCSTPADPQLWNRVNGIGTYYVNTNCIYTGTFSDPRPGGNLVYDPDVYNIMSYSRDVCRNRFFDEQGDVMYNNIQTEPVLQATKSTTCQLPYIVGVNSICGDEIKTYTFNYAINGSNTVDSWSVSSNMQIVNQTSSQIQVKRVPNQSGIGTITAIINGHTVTKDVQLTGAPTISNYNIQGVGSTVNIYSVTNMTVVAATNAISYEWSIVNDYNNCPGQSNKPVFKDFNNSTQATTTTPNIWVNWRSCLGTFRLRCKAVSSCGFTYYSDKQVTVVNDPCPPQLTLTPNPASGDFTAEMMGPAPCRLSQPTIKLEGTVTYSIYTNNGILVFKKEKANPQETMSVKGLKKGMYYVEAILPDNRRIAKPLIVN